MAPLVRRTRRARSALAVLLLVAATTVPSSHALVQEPPAPEAPARPVPPVEDQRLLQRVAVLGASASAGFNLEQELDRRRGLAGLLPELLREDPARAVLDASDELTFLEPLPRARAQVDRVLEHRPTAVIALDFLFWFAYGPLPERERAPLFERGLEQLARLRAPLVVGDLPDMRGARSVMLPAEYVPSEATLAALNERLAAWAKSREDVHVVPLTSWMRRLRAGEAFELRGESWEEGDARDLLQWDELHPSVEGSLFLLALALDALDRAARGALEGEVDWQVRRVAERVLDAGE